MSLTIVRQVDDIMSLVTLMAAVTIVDNSDNQLWIMAFSYQPHIHYYSYSVT